MILARRWRHGLHINEAETRAALSGQVAVSHRSSAQGLDFADLSDNSGPVGICSKGRCSKFNLNLLMRRRHACKLISDVRLLCTWVDTVHEHSDWDTRWITGATYDRAAGLGIEEHLSRGFLRLCAACQCSRGGRSPGRNGVGLAVRRSVHLRTPKNLNRSFALLSTGHIHCVWWRTPCSSYSTARRWGGGAPPLRLQYNVAVP